jgi:hypothetical protein
MKQPVRSALTLIAGLTLGTPALATGLTHASYQALEKQIEADHRVARAACGSLAGNGREVCIAEAKGKASVARAELEDQHRPGAPRHNAVRVAKAEAEYAVARQRCDDKGSNEKDVCVQEAKAGRVRALADAKVRLETNNANVKAQEVSAEANAVAKAAGAEVRRDAAADTQNADYAVAKERCDALASLAKDDCLSAARTKYGKN